MTLAEFKAWFEGFTESIEGAPTEAQFAKIKDKVALIDGSPVTQPIFVERYWPWPWAPYWVGPVWAGTSVTIDAVASEAGNVTFDSISAMTALGRAEAMN